MGNIESYLKWRGDLSFSERPFCEVDNLIFSEITYFDLAGGVPGRSSILFAKDFGGNRTAGLCGWPLQRRQSGALCLPHLP